MNFIKKYIIYNKQTLEVVHSEGLQISSFEKNTHQNTPWAYMALATLRNPAVLAPLT